MVVAEVKGMSRWDSEEETIQFLEEQAGEEFWEVSARLPDVYLSCKERV